MKKILILFCVLIATSSYAQIKVYGTKTGKVKFYSHTAAEDIEAINNQTEVKVATNGQMVFNLLIKGFVFKNALMQTHFNENYMESSKFPKAGFKGTIDDLKKVDFTKDGSYSITVSGDMTIHGTTQKIKAAPGTIEIKAGKVMAKSKFTLKVKDYGIKGNYIGEKIANELEISVDCTLN